MAADKPICKKCGTEKISMTNGRFWFVGCPTCKKTKGDPPKKDDPPKADDPPKGDAKKSWLKEVADDWLG